jgi:hypothetical protein
MAMGGTIDFKGFLRAIGNRDHDAVLALLTEAPRLATASLIRRDEFFLTERFAQVYQGDTALHAAGFSYDSEMARALVALGVIGNPASPTWNPADQRDVIMFLIECGADPNATAAGGVTPLHRAVRNRCSSAVETLLRAGADPHLLNESGSTARDLATLTTGRGGSGSAEAKAEQRIILELLETSAL